MSHIISVLLFEYDDLPTEKAKKRARDWYCEDGHNIHDGDIEGQMHQFLEEAGLHECFDVHYSLGNCQGDGACFSGSVDLAEFYAGQVKVRDQLKLGQTIMSDLYDPARVHPDVKVGDQVIPVAGHPQWDIYLAWPASNGYLCTKVETEGGRVRVSRVADMHVSVKERLEALYVGDSVFHDIKWLVDKEISATIRIQQRGRYTHWNSMDLTVSADDYGQFSDHTDDIDTKLSVLETYLHETWAKAVARHLEKVGYAAIEDANSEEVVAENIRANEYTFTKDGKRYMGPEPAELELLEGAGV